MYKYSFAILALTSVSAISRRHHHHHNAPVYDERQALAELKHNFDKLETKYEALEAKALRNERKYNLIQKRFADGMSEDEKLEEKIRMKGGKGMENIRYIALDSSAPTWPVKGDKEAIVDANELVDYAEGAEKAAQSRLPYRSTLVQTSVSDPAELTIPQKYVNFGYDRLRTSKG
jgi:hypothetical protein